MAEEISKDQSKVFGGNVYVPLALVFTVGLNIAGAFYTFGIQSQKIAALEERVNKQEGYQTQYITDVATLKEQSRQFGDTLSDVRADVKTLLNSRIK